METLKYSKFKIKDNNRPINESLVKKIKSSINEFGFIKSRPVLVDKDFKIIDGQHRFKACESLGIPVVFEFAPEGFNPDDIMIKLNSVQSTWRLYDYVNHFASKNIPFYQEVQRFENQYKMGISNTLILLTKGTKPKPQGIREGKNHELNEKRFEILNFLHNNKILPYWKNSKFVYAVAVLFDKADKKQIDKLQTRLLSVPAQVSARDYLNVFENIINRRTRKKIIKL